MIDRVYGWGCGVLQPADRLLVPAVEETLAALTLTEADTAAVKLARRYATAIDQDGDLQRLGPALLSCLAALNATPAARGRLRQEVTDAPTGGLRKLREARRA